MDILSRFFDSRLTSFRDYMMSGESDCFFYECEIEIRQTMHHETENQGTMKWVDEAQLMKKYQGNATTVKAIIKEKCQEGLVMDNPDAKGHAEHRLYRCFWALTVLRECFVKCIDLYMMFVRRASQVAERNKALNQKIISCKQKVFEKVAKALMARNDGQRFHGRIDCPEMSTMPALEPLNESQMAAVQAAAIKDEGKKKGAEVKKKIKAETELPESALEKAKLVAEQIATDAATLSNLAFRLQGVTLAEGCRKQILEHAVFFQKQYPC